MESATSATSATNDAVHISLEEVRHVARLARLELSDDEIVTLQGELSALLDHVDKVRRLDTADVPPTAHPLPLYNVLRADVPRPCLERKDVLAAAPAVERDRFLVPAILGEAP
jgi:aspartyl-tRNA(Asn)/glutamyl-tRNA(Gln) amidotransferase subunit C